MSIERFRRADGEQVDCPYSLETHTRTRVYVHIVHLYSGGGAEQVFELISFVSTRGHDPEASRTLAFPSPPSRLPYPRGSSTRYLFRVGFPLTLYSDTMYALNGSSASRVMHICAYEIRHLAEIGAGRIRIRDNLTLETESARGSCGSHACIQTSYQCDIAEREWKREKKRLYFLSNNKFSRYINSH